MRNLFDCENMKKEEAGGIGWMVVAGAVDIRRGRADTVPFSSSATKPSVSCSSANQNLYFSCFSGYVRLAM